MSRMHPGDIEYCNKQVDRIIEAIRNPDVDWTQCPHWQACQIKEQARGAKEPEQDWRILQYRPQDGEPVDVGTYQVIFKNDLMITTFKPIGSINPKAPQLGWLDRETSGNGYMMHSISEDDSLVIEAPRGQKLGPVLGWVSWVFYTTNHSEER